MRKKNIGRMCFLCLILLCGCNRMDSPSSIPQPSSIPTNPTMDQVKEEGNVVRFQTHNSPTASHVQESLLYKTVTIEVGNKTFTAILADNPSAQKFKAILPLTIQMGDLNKNENYYYLPDPLPTKSQSSDGIQSGDIMLYGTDCLVLFYESFTSSYSYTRLGTVNDSTGLKEALGSGTIAVNWTVK